MKQLGPWNSQGITTPPPPPQTLGILTKLFFTSGPNLVLPAWTGGELSRGQLKTQNWVKLDFEEKFDFEGQGQSPPNTIGTLTKVFCNFGSNLVILAWTGHELSHGQARDWHMDGHTWMDTHGWTHMDGHTEAGNNNTQRPKLALGKNQQCQWHQQLCYRSI